MAKPLAQIARVLIPRPQLAAVVAALFLSVTTVACGSSSSSDSGGAAPDFNLPVANRTVDITLSDFRSDQNVVLVFYRGFF